MIDVLELKRPEDVGRWVVYTDGAGETERGKIKSWNNSGIFVVYNADDNWDGNEWMNYTAAHTRPEDLEFEE